jgi:plastocyanin
VSRLSNLEGALVIRIVLTLAAALTAVVLAATSASAAAPRLVGSTGPDGAFHISLTKGGKKVTKLKAGKYTIVVKDISKTHNFHLSGPGVNKKTSVTGKATSTWHVTLKKGTYRYVCDPHKTIMKGSFKVT